MRRYPGTQGARRLGRCAVLGLLATACAGLLGACSISTDLFSSAKPPPPPPQSAAAPPTTGTALGTGQVKVAVILPLTASGNAGLTAQTMKNAADLALSEFNNPDIQILVKDDAGSPTGAQQAAQQALTEGAEIILGPLFAQSVGPAGQVARTRGVPVIAFSTDASVAARGVYLLSFLPESDVERVLDYAFANGKRSFAALIPENAYGNVVEAEFRQIVARKGGRIVAIEHYGADRAQQQEPVRRVAAAAAQADTIFIPDGPEGLASIAQALGAAGVSSKRLQFIGTGLWDDQRVFSEESLQGGWFAAPDQAGYRNFSNRYRKKFGQEPQRAATLTYDAVSLVAALVKTQGTARFSDEILTNASGFSGIDGIFRFRPDGTNQRGLAVMRVTNSGPQVVSPPPKSFGGSAT